MIQRVELGCFMALQFSDGVRAAAVMCEIVQPGGIDEQRNDPRRIRLQRQLHHIEHQLSAWRKGIALRVVPWRLGIHFGLWLELPLLGAVHAPLQFADGREVLIHPVLIAF